jgi:hypothetical protein
MVSGGPRPLFVTWALRWVNHMETLHCIRFNQTFTRPKLDGPFDPFLKGSIYSYTNKIALPVL